MSSTFALATNHWEKGALLRQTDSLLEAILGSSLAEMTNLVRFKITRKQLMTFTCTTPILAYQNPLEEVALL